jgi:uncharacterized membrane protein
MRRHCAPPPEKTNQDSSFMKSLSKYFFRGLITILPVALTLYLLFMFLAWMEAAVMWVLDPLIGSIYVPGMGLVFGVLIIVAIGFLLSKPNVKKMLSVAELPFTYLPVVKSIYSSLKSFADYFSPTANQGNQSVVILRMPGHGLEIVGLITRRSFADLPQGFLPGERVAVYLPMGYMIGGYTVFVPADWVQAIDMSVEEAMRSSLIAWMARPPASAVNADNAGPDRG